MTGDSEKLALVLPECDGNNCPEISIERLSSNQAFIDELIDQQIAGGFSQHPEFAEIDWSTVQFTLNREALNADFSKTLAEQGFDHKSLLRFVTPNLTGYKGSHV